MTATDPAADRAVVLFDGDCRFCRKSVALLRRLDWAKSLHFQSARDVDRLPPSAVPLVPAELLTEMHLVTPDRRRVLKGFRAIRWLAWRLPALMPVAPLLYLPGVLPLGDRVYRWVARNRFDLVPCHDGGCAVRRDGQPERGASAPRVDPESLHTRSGG